jgi:hypothetical protein
MGDPAQAEPERGTDSSGWDTRPEPAWRNIDRQSRLGKTKEKPVQRKNLCLTSKSC